MPVYSSTYGGIAAFAEPPAGSNNHSSTIVRRAWLMVNVAALMILVFDPPSWLWVERGATVAPLVAMEASPDIRALRASNWARLPAAAKSAAKTREVCTTVSSAAAEWYSDLFSYRMRTPDLAARVAIIVVPDDRDFESELARLHDTAAVRRLLQARGHVATCACDYDVAWAFSPATTRRRYLPGGILPHGTHVAAGILDIARDSLHAAGMRTISLRLRIRRHARGGADGGGSRAGDDDDDDGGVASVGRASAKPLTREERWARRRVMHRIGAHPDSTPATFAADLAGAAGIAAAHIGFTAQPDRYPATRSVAHARYLIALRALAIEERGGACALTRLANLPALLRKLDGDDENAEDANHVSAALDQVATALAMR